MAKITLSPITGSYASVVALNNRFQQIEDALNDNVLWRDGFVGEPNAMDVDLDMAGNTVLNAVFSGDLLLQVGYAEEWAQNAEDSAVSTAAGGGAGEYSALHHSAKANAQRVLAETAKEDAETAEDNAVSAKEDAETAETNAAASAVLAEDWASEDEDVAVAGGEYSAKHYSKKAEASASGLLTRVVLDTPVLLHSDTTSLSGFTWLNSASFSASDTTLSTNSAVRAVVKTYAKAVETSGRVSVDAYVRKGGTSLSANSLTMVATGENSHESGGADAVTVEAIGETEVNLDASSTFDLECGCGPIPPVASVTFRCYLVGYSYYV